MLSSKRPTNLILHIDPLANPLPSFFLTRLLDNHLSKSGVGVRPTGTDWVTVIPDIVNGAVWHLFAI